MLSTYMLKAQELRIIEKIIGKNRERSKPDPVGTNFVKK